MPSYGGSFAGGFIKSYLAVMQMAMRKRQMDTMEKFYGMMMKQMQSNIDAQGEKNKWAEKGREGAWGGSSSLPRGTRNNNPGNLEASDEVKKMPGYKGSDGRFAIFDTPEHGEAALDKNLQGYGEKGLNTPAAIAAKWAPPNENDTAKYAKGLADSLGIGVNDKIDLSDSAVRAKLGSAINTLENGPQASAIDNRDSSSAKTYLASVSDHPDRTGDTSNMRPEFATRLASAIKQANAEGIPARVGSGYRDADELLRQGDRSHAAYFDAAGNSNHTKGDASDVAGIGTPGSATAKRWAEIADANGLSVPYGYNNAKEWNHTELAGLTSLRGAQPPDAAVVAATQPFRPYQVAGADQPPPASATGPAIPIGGGAGNVLEAPTGTPVSSTPIGGGAGNVQEAPTGTPAAPAAPAAPTAAPAAPQAIPARGVAPGTVQYNTGGVRGQQPGGGPIYTTGNFGPLTQQGQPAAVAAPVAAPLPATTGAAITPIPPPDPRTGIRPQQVPLSQAPMPPPRPENFGGEADTTGNIVPAAQPPASAGGANVASADPLWFGYAGASPEQAASADPLNSMYAANQTFSSSAGLTDTSGLMAAGQMANIAMSDDSDLTANMYKGGPVIIRRFASGGGVDDDMLSEYGGTDSGDPMANLYWDQQRMASLTNNSEASGPDLPTSIQNRAALTPQDEAQLQPPAPPTFQPTVEGQPSAQPTSEQPAAPPSEEPIPPQPTSQSDIPPGSVQVAGPGGWGSVREATNIPLPRVGGTMGMGSGMRMPRPSISALTGGRKATGVGKLGNQELYTPEGMSGNDFNHVGLAPVSNPDGNPSVWLMNMVDNGMRALVTGFGLMNRGAMPGSPEQAQNLQHFASNDSPSMPSKDDMNNMGDMIDPKHQLYEGGRDIGGAVGMIKYYAITGQLDAASRLAGGVLLYTRMMSMQYGDEAVKSLFNGDYKNAVKSLQDGYNWVPDAKTANIKNIDEKTGKVTAQQKDGNGNVIAEQDYLPAAIMKAALGLKDGTGYWNMLSSLARAGGNDPMGSHYETQKLLRGIQGNENVPPGPFSTPPKTTPVSAPTPAPIDASTQPPAPDQTQPPAPDQTQPPAPDQTQPVIPSRDAGPNATVGQAAPPPTSTAQAGPIPDRGTVPPNLVAGPGAPSTTAPIPAPTGGSGSVLVAQQQQREQAAQENAAVTRMVASGAVTADDPYMQQKIADINAKYINPLQTYRSNMENQFVAIEGADISPAEKKQLQVALTAKLKNFDEVYMKPAVANANKEWSAVKLGVQQKFRVAMQQAQVQENMRKEGYEQEKGNVASQMKYREPRNQDDEQFNLIDGIDKSGRGLIDPATGQGIVGYGDALSAPFGASREVTVGTDADGKALPPQHVPVNPLETYSHNMPFLSSTYDGKNSDTFDMHKITTPDGEPLFKAGNVNTMVDASKDMLTYDKGMDARKAKDFTTGVATGNYTIQIDKFNMPRSPMLTNAQAPDLIDENGRMKAPDGTDRVVATISRGPNDPGTQVVMSKSMAFKLKAINEDAVATINFNRGKAIEGQHIIHNPAPTPIPQAPPRAPSNASKSDVQQPPIGPRTFAHPWDAPMTLQ